MAIDLYSENSGAGNNITMSPRISFSHDFSQSDSVPVEQLLRSFSSSSDFNFCVHQNPDASMADELFSDGKIIPAQIKQQPPPSPPLPPQLPTHRTPPAPVDDDQPNSSKSFWRFNRSSSCGNGYGRSLCPIPLLSRSNSTGSTASTKRSSSSSKDHKHHHHNHANFQKPPLRKTSYSYGNSTNAGNGVRINPVLNLGFGSLFSTSKKK